MSAPFDTNRREGQLVLIINWEDGSITPHSAVATREEAEQAAEEYLEQVDPDEDNEREHHVAIVPATFFNR